MVDDFKVNGTVACAKNQLNSLVKTTVSWSAQSIITRPVTQSGPADSLGFTVALTSLFLYKLCVCSFRMYVPAGQFAFCMTLCYFYFVATILCLRF